jgi:hypothetical protein
MFKFLEQADLGRVAESTGRTPDYASAKSFNVTHRLASHEIMLNRMDGDVR